MVRCRIYKILVELTWNDPIRMCLLNWRENTNMATFHNKKYDLVVFGATGYTGQFVIEEVAKAFEREKTKSKSLSWAVAGRNKGKVEDYLNFARKDTGLEMKDVDILEVDVKNEKSIDYMTKNSFIVINCVGPYHLYGKPVVKSCVDNGANHIDLAGEQQYMDGMKLLYGKEAEEANVHIINACGFDSVPADVGLMYLKQKFDGTLNSAKGFGGLLGKFSPLNTGTMESGALAISNFNEIREIRSKLYLKELPKPQHKVSRRTFIHKEQDNWLIPHPLDEVLVERTQRYLFEKNEKPIQYYGYVASPNPLLAFGCWIGALFFIMFSYFSLTRMLLFKHPRLMTLGIFRKGGPKKENLKKMGFFFRVIAKGWKNTRTEEEKKLPPKDKISLYIEGPDPAYRATSMLMVACAFTILREKNNLSEKGGVMSPGTAFYKTDLVSRIQDAGITWKIDNE